MTGYKSTFLLLLWALLLTSNAFADVDGSVPSNCNDPEQWLGDGYCDETANNPACAFDHGDCCQSTCEDATYACGFNGYYCLTGDDDIQEDTTDGGAVLDDAGQDDVALNNEVFDDAGPADAVLDDAGPSGVAPGNPNADSGPQDVEAVGNDAGGNLAPVTSNTSAPPLDRSVEARNAAKRGQAQCSCAVSNDAHSAPVYALLGLGLLLLPKRRPAFRAR